MAKKDPNDPLITDGIAIAREDHKRAPLSSMGRQMAEVLAQYPKVAVFLPLPDGVTREKADAMEKPPALPVALNGYTFLIRRGFRVEVPSPIADIIHESLGGQ